MTSIFVLLQASVHPAVPPLEEGAQARFERLSDLRLDEGKVVDLSAEDLFRRVGCGPIRRMATVLEVDAGCTGSEHPTLLRLHLTNGVPTEIEVREASALSHYD